MFIYNIQTILYDSFIPTSLYMNFIYIPVGIFFVYLFIYIILYVIKERHSLEEFINIAGKSDSIQNAINSRHSIREFTDHPIPDTVLQQIIQTSLRTPSWKNAQPWKLRIVSGESRKKLSSALLDVANNSQPNPEAPWLDNFPSEAKRRMFDLGMKIYGVAGIERKDKNARDNFMLQNFKFFGAPTAIIITTTFDLNFFVGIDLGCYVQSVLLLAREFGLGTCAQAALGAFPETIKKELELPKEEKVVMGISIGYPKPDSNLNRFHTPREPMDQLVKFYT